MKIGDWITVLLNGQRIHTRVYGEVYASGKLVAVEVCISDRIIEYEIGMVINEGG